MTNILVIDSLGECGILVKGVLMGKYYGVSLSCDYNEANQKLNTGLFDIVCLNTNDTAHKKFLNELRHNLPGLPVIALAEGSLSENTQGKIFRSIPKPLNITQLTTVVKEAIALPEKVQHHTLSLPAEITAAKTTLKCLLTDLGLKGALVRSDIATDPEAKQFSSFFLKGFTKMVTSILARNTEPIKVSSQIAFTENRPDGNLKQAGLRFSSLGAKEQKLLEGLITQAA